MSFGAPNPPHYLSHAPIAGGNYGNGYENVAYPSLYSAEETVVVPLAGAFNFGIGDFTTARPHWSKLSHELTRQLGVIVTAPVVPTKLGLCDTEEAYQHFTDDFDKTIARLDPTSHIVLLGHSLGGALGLRLIADRRYTDQVAGFVAVSSPLTELKHTVLDPFHVKTKAIGAFAQTTLEQMADSDIDNGITLFGSIGDLLVPAVYTLPELPSAERNLYSLLPKHTMGIRGATELVGKPVGHIGAITNGRSMKHIVGAVDEIFNIDMMARGGHTASVALTS